MKVLIVYYSTCGNVYRMAQLVGDGVREVRGAGPAQTTTPELRPSRLTVGFRRVSQ